MSRETAILLAGTGAIVLGAIILYNSSSSAASIAGGVLVAAGTVMDLYAVTVHLGGGVHYQLSGRR